MKKMILLLSILFSIPTYAQSFLDLAGLNPSTQYQHFETDHFEFTYQDGYLSFTREAAKHLEHAHQIISPLLKWSPRSKIHVLVADNEDSANGFAMPALRVGIVLIATPPDQALSTSYTENWIKLLVFHEYTHILNIDPTTEWMEWVRVVFGDVIRPNGLWPTWMLEGLAVYYETKTSILGRGRSPYYDAIVRSYFNEGKLGIDKNNGLTYGRLSGSWPYFPGGETAYLFGYQLWNQFGKLTKNDEKIADYSINSSHRIPFFIDGNLENVTGKEWGDLWNSFVTDSSARYSEEIKKVKSLGETPYTKITNSNYSANGGAISPNREWLAFTETKLDERQGLTLQNLKSGVSKKIRDKAQGISMAFDPESKNLIFSSLSRNTTYTEFSDLWNYNLEQKDFQKLTDGMRAKDPHFSSDGKKIVFTTVDHATQILKIADYEIKNEKPMLSHFKTIYIPSEFAMIGTPHWINNVEVVFSLQELNQAESKILKISSEPNSVPSVLVQNGKMNRFPFYCNQQLYYVSDITGIDNVYAGSEAKTNVITGVQSPFCSINGELYSSLLTSNGFEIVKFEPSATQLKTTDLIATTDAPASINKALQSPELKIEETSIHSYSPWRTLAPRQWAPFGYFNYDGNSGTSVGGILLGFDSTGKHQYLGTFQYNFKSSTFDQSFAYTYYGFRPAITLSEDSNTSDIASDVNQSNFKRSNEVKLQLDYPIRWTCSSMRISPYAFMNWNSYRNLFSGLKESSADPEYNHAKVPGTGVVISYSDEVQSKLGFISEGGSKITTETQARIYQNDFTLWRSLVEYSRFFSTGSHYVLNPKLRYLGSSHPYDYERSYALLKGKNTNDLFDDGSGFSLSRMQIRGYPNMSIKTKTSVQGALDFHFPIDTIYNGSGPLFFNQAHGFVFAESTYIPSTKYVNLFLPSFGLGITADTTFFWHAPLSINLEMQYGTKKDFGGDQTFFVTISTSGI